MRENSEETSVLQLNGFYTKEPTTPNTEQQKKISKEIPSLFIMAV